jgi:hypothetical protein
VSNNGLISINLVLRMTPLTSNSSSGSIARHPLNSTSKPRKIILKKVKIQCKKSKKGVANWRMASSDESRMQIGGLGVEWSREMIAAFKRL